MPGNRIHCFTVGQYRLSRHIAAGKIPDDHDIVGDAIRLPENIVFALDDDRTAGAHHGLSLRLAMPVRVVEVEPSWVIRRNIITLSQFIWRVLTPQ